jgi:hypothetical protein
LLLGKGGETQRIHNLAQLLPRPTRLVRRPASVLLTARHLSRHAPHCTRCPLAELERDIWGLEMFGDYDVDEFMTGPGAEVRDNAVHAIAVLYATLGRAPETLRLHKEDTATTHKHCPGKHVDKQDMIARIAQAMSDLHPR